MKQKSTKTVVKKTISTKPEKPLLNFFYGLILFGYSFITVITPNLNTLDSNGPKFYTLAIVNLIAYIIILVENWRKPKQEFYGLFFRSWIGFIYTLFLVVSLLSFFKAYNIYESIINFSKLFTIFSAAYIIAIILRSDKRYVYIISISLAILLIIDSFTVFYHIVNSLMEKKGQILKKSSLFIQTKIFWPLLFLLRYLLFYGF
jgi:hypothetical protein